MKKLLIMLLLLPAAVCSCGKVELGNIYKGDNPPYKVGDIYYKDGVKGIVFYVTDNGQHGKIVSADATKCEWSTERVVTGATDENDGMANMKKIQEISGWHEKYPAFAWCADKGDGWYLPALYEMEMIREAISIHTLISFIANSWSSTEDDYYCAWFVNMNNDDTDRLSKSLCYYVRAVSTF